MVQTYRSMKGADSNYLCLCQRIVKGWFRHNRANVARSVRCSSFFQRLPTFLCRNCSTLLTRYSIVCTRGNREQNNLGCHNSRLVERSTEFLASNKVRERGHMDGPVNCRHVLHWTTLLHILKFELK